MPDETPIKAIASANGLEATKLAYEQMRSGADTLAAAVAGVTIVEDDPEDMTVGLGGLPNENGVVELDAAVMHGPTHQAGAVACLQKIRNAAQVAKLVMEQTDHVLLVGEGALAFARAQGFEDQELLTNAARNIWLYWKQTNSDQDDWLPPPVDQLDPAVRKFFRLSDEGAPQANPEAEQLPLSEADRPTGTIHCACINDRCDISCTTTTSGLAFKIPGRVGDSPIIGAGLYVDNEIGSCGSTGRGEANLQNLCSFAAVELMRGDATPEEAGMEILRRVVNHSAPRLLNDTGRPRFSLKFYLLNRQGEHAGVSLFGPTTFAITDKDGSRHEQCAYLHERA